ncbi:helix-turn-helix transcriptional regulator [Burkholderia latens]|uniref:helix-turn-helix domain-containing protein n=1 Tax=Burkholderia latens TaxID=488446 RepID=UPI001C95A4DE|nr:helix-turn-helix transcriptional regulator [Burkholderia latens]MBY4692617.1 helix-turn-helix transcriptional regulator [Burkholderia latens]
MDIAELLDAAKRKKKTLGAVADGLGVHQNRLSEWRKGTYKPDATTIAQLAEMAELPIFETVAQIEASLDQSKAAGVWERALGKLRAAGVAATVTLGLAIYSTTPNEADAAVKNFVTPTPAQPAPALGNGAKAIHVMSNKWEDRKPGDRRS